MSSKVSLSLAIATAVLLAAAALFQLLEMKSLDLFSSLREPSAGKAAPAAPAVQTAPSAPDKTAGAAGAAQSGLFPGKSAK